MKLILSFYKTLNAENEPLERNFLEIFSYALKEQLIKQQLVKKNIKLTHPPE